MGKANFFLNNVSMYLNDGKGTPALSKIKNLSVDINNLIKEENKVVLRDTVLPEKFNIIRTRDPLIYDNKYFAVFSTTDKGSGVDHYKVCELFSCAIEESPYLLKNQTPFYKLVVYAYDGEGNSRISFIVSPWLILLLAIVAMIMIFLFIYRRYFYHHKI